MRLISCVLGNHDVFSLVVSSLIAQLMGQSDYPWQEVRLFVTWKSTIG
jgi:hypothetical protein